MGTNLVERWSGKVAVVTGASSGIGEAIVESLSASGLRVVAAARRMDRLESLASRLEGDVYPLHVDLRDEQSVHELFKQTRRQVGPVDILVNNAGLGRKASLIDGNPDHFREMLDVNVMGLLLCTQEALVDMRRSDRGHIIHISSMSGHRVPGASGVYSASKFAVRALTEALRQELRALGSQVRVSAVSPGLVETEFAETFLGTKEAAAELYSQFQMLRPQDIANTVQFLIGQPDHMEVHDVLLRPTAQQS